MKFILALSILFVLSSCGKIQRIMDGTENLPNQIDETNKGMAKTNEAIRKQKLSEALKIMQDKNNRKATFPIPTDMMAAAKTMGEALTVDEVVLFVKNYLIKINNYQYEEENPNFPTLEEVEMPAQPQAPVEPKVGDDGKMDPGAMVDYQYQSYLYQNRMVQYNSELQKYLAVTAENNRKTADYENKLAQVEQRRVEAQADKQADLYMLMMVTGFLPDETIEQMVKQEVNQGAYREIALSILKMRADFYNDIMLEAGMLQGNKNKLDTLGKIKKAIEYAEKINYICKLSYSDLIALKIEGFSNKKVNENLSKPLDKNLALALWVKIEKKALEDFKAHSFDKDPAVKAASEKEYTAGYKKALELIKNRIDNYGKSF